MCLNKNTVTYRDRVSNDARIGIAHNNTVIEISVENSSCHGWCEVLFEQIFTQCSTNTYLQYFRSHDFFLIFFFHLLFFFLPLLLTVKKNNSILWFFIKHDTLFITKWTPYNNILHALFKSQCKNERFTISVHALFAAISQWQIRCTNE